jgi:hypothetical protein
MKEYLNSLGFNYIEEIDEYELFLYDFRLSTWKSLSKGNIWVFSIIDKDGYEKIEKELPDHLIIDYIKYYIKQYHRLYKIKNILNEEN